MEKKVTEPTSTVHAGFKKLSTKTIFEGRVFSLFEDSWESPDAETFVRQIVRNRGAVAVVPMHDDGTVTVIHQFRPAFGEYMWEIPAGLLDKPGEAPEAAARRELREEVGYECASLRKLITLRPAAGLSDESITIYLAEGLTFVGVEADGPEERYIKIERLQVDAVKQMISNGEINDSKTVVGIAMAFGSAPLNG